MDPLIVNSASGQTLEIEFACSHNHGRSPLAQAFAQRFINMYKIPGYKAVSSGTAVDFINGQLEGTIPFSQKDIASCVQAASARNLAGPNGDVQLWARNLFRRFVDEEHEYRAHTFDLLGLGKPKDAHDQSVYRPHVVLSLGMEQKHVDVLSGIYTGRAVVASLADFATNGVQKSFKSGFAGSQTDYVHMAYEEERLVDLGMKKYFESIGLL